MRARVLETFVAEEAEEISAKQGDIMKVIKNFGDGWCKVQFQNKIGIFPEDFLEVIVEKAPAVARPPATKPRPGKGIKDKLAAVLVRGSGGPRATKGAGPGAPPPPPQSTKPKAFTKTELDESKVQARAVAEYIPTNPRELGFKKDDLVTLLVDTNNTWWKGERNGKFGYFPKENVRKLDPTRSAVEHMKDAEEAALSPIELKRRRAQQRPECVREIIATEESYVRDLELVIRVFITPMRQQKIISTQDLSGLFSNLELILSVNKKVLEGLRSAPNVGAVFLSMVDFFKMYCTYCGNQPTALATLERCEKEPEFQKLIEATSTNSDCRGLSLASFLISPIQRICKYPLLLKELLKNTERSHPDYANLTEALAKINEVVTEVNERKRLSENFKKIMEIRANIEGLTEELMSSSRRFLREENIKEVKKGKPLERKIFLFNDLFLTTKVTKSGKGQLKLVSMFPLDKIKIIDVGDTPLIKNAWEISYRDKSQRYTFCVATPEAKKKWLGDIKKIVKAYQRKMWEEKKNLASGGVGAPRDGFDKTGKPRGKGNLLTKFKNSFRKT